MRFGKSTRNLFALVVTDFILAHNKPLTITRCPRFIHGSLDTESDVEDQHSELRICVDPGL